MNTRRQFIKAVGVAGMGMFLPARGMFVQRANASIPGGTLAPAAIPKYAMPLIIPPAMPYSGAANRYEIAVREFLQQVLPPGLPLTTVWSYGSANNPGTFNFPAFTIEAQYNTPLQIKWINDLKDAAGNYRQHLLPVDPTLHWANPPGPIDMRPMFESTPGAYTGPVPMVPHVHGAHVAPESDGYPEAWWLPAANDIPAGFARKGSKYASPKGDPNEYLAGAAVFEYTNDQRATTLWYHDHSLGMTRLNVYAGPAGFYLIRGGPDDMVRDVSGRQAKLPGPAPAIGDKPGTKYYEIPIAIQDRSFNDDGSLFYPDSRFFFDGFAGPYVPNSDMAPIWNPEFFGNTMVVNGRTWPYLEVEPRRYRLRLLNGCNSRFLLLKFSEPQTQMWQIGTDGGFLPKPVKQSQLLLAPAERADVIVDFSNFRAGSEIILLNLAPDEPFGGGVPNKDFLAADPASTGQVMQFRVVNPGKMSLPDDTTHPARLMLPEIQDCGVPSVARQLTLNEADSETLEMVGPSHATLGTLNADGTPNPLLWMDPITENPALGSTELWELVNLTADAHPIHLHQVMFQVLNRQDFLTGKTRRPEASETGFKDTVIAYPGEITRIKAKFDIPGLFVWHCHIVEHEDNEMMRPFYVGPMTHHH